LIAMRNAAVVTAALFAASAAPAIAAAPIEGTWRTEGKDALVQIGDCGASVCGRIARFLVVPPQGAGQHDVNNPDARLRTRKLLGLPILTGLADDGDLWRGTIYDPKSGKSYRSLVRRLDADRLEVKGCIGPFCKTQIWRRAG
jgi:uncharacterized protein (DUF2147 family)